MPQSDQGVTRDRYTVIPRTAVFLRREDSYLLLKGASTKRLWANKYNGLGGHVERGEDLLSAARRELLEETGLSADLWLCGTLIVDAGEVGICLYFFLGENAEGSCEPRKRGWRNGSRSSGWGNCPSWKICLSCCPRSMACSAAIHRLPRVPIMMSGKD